MHLLALEKEEKNFHFVLYLQEIIQFQHDIETFNHKI